MLLFIKTVIPTVTGNALGFFTGSRNVVPFSVDLSDFCRSFRVESSNTIKIFKGCDVLLINQVRTRSSKETVFFEFLVTIWYLFFFRTQNRMNCKLCRIIRRDLGFILAAHRFCKGKVYSNSTNLSTEFWS